MNDNIKNEMLKYAPALALDYKNFVTKTFESIEKQFGIDLKGIYNSYSYRTFQGIRCNLKQTQIEYNKYIYEIDNDLLERNSQKYGIDTALLWYEKMICKLGDLDNVTVTPPNNSGDVTITGTHIDNKIIIKQYPIINMSKYGTLFHQFPARIYVNGKAQSENEYKRTLLGWNVKPIVREQKPKRAPIDVDSRPKQFYFTFKVDVPAHNGYPANLGIAYRHDAKGMTADEALTKIIKNETRFDRDYPESQRCKVYGFELDAVYAWNSRPLWKKSQGTPCPYKFQAPLT